MDKIKVVFYLKNLGLGGTEKSALLCSRGLNKNDFDVTFITHAEGDKTRLSEFHSCFANKLLTINNQQELRPILDRIKPDIFQVYRSGQPEWPEPGIDIEVPYFCEVNVFGIINPNPKISRSLFMSRWLMNDSLSKYQLNKLDKRWDYLYNPVDSPYSDSKLDLGLEPGTIILGRCGRSDPGIYDDIGIKAMRLLIATHYKIHFLVVSPPPNMLADLIEYGIPYTVIEPTIDPILLSKFYNTIDIYCSMRADGESFGSNIAEAMIHSKPVVTHIAIPRYSGMGVFQAQTEVVSDKITGFVVDRSPSLYADAISNLINNVTLRQQMGRAGYTKAMSNYHTPVVCAKLAQIYKDLMK